MTKIPSMRCYVNYRSTSVWLPPMARCYLTEGNRSEVSMELLKVYGDRRGLIIPALAVGKLYAASAVARHPPIVPPWSNVISTGMRTPTVHFPANALPDPGHRCPGVGPMWRQPRSSARCITAASRTTAATVSLIPQYLWLNSNSPRTIFARTIADCSLHTRYVKDGSYGL